VEKIFIIIINKNGTVKPKTAKNPYRIIKYFLQKILTICGIKKSFPQQNVDFVENLLINPFLKYLSTFIVFFVENLVYLKLINFKK
jgi:hypothetical protein